MYSVLDSLQAVECGDSTAFVNFEYATDLLATLGDTIKQHVTLDRRSRIYVIFPAEGGKYKGRFLFGRRKQPAWAGYAVQGSEEDDAN